MSDGRKRLSGSEYRKIRCEKQKKVEEAIRSSQKVSEYFQRTTITTFANIVPALPEESSEPEQFELISLDPSPSTSNVENKI